MNLIKKIIFFLNFLNIFKTRLKFFPPKKCKILVYDIKSVLSDHSKILFNKKKIEIFYNRNQQINLYILIKSLLFFFKFKDLNKNYKFYYFQAVSPKIIYTAVDNNPSFFLLKSIYPKAIYIADQNATRDDHFFNYCLNQIKKKNIRYEVDYFFVFGEYEKTRLKGVIDAKIIVSGNTRNNNILIKKTIKKEKIITYISSKFKLRSNLEKKIFNHLITFGQKFNYKLFFLDHPNQNNKSLLKKVFRNKSWSYANYKKQNYRYNLLKKSKIIVFAHSTLGYECLSRNFKILALNQKKYFNQVKKNYGDFWCSPDDYNKIEYKLLKILSTDKKKWKKIAKHYAKKILFFDVNNSKKKKIIKKILNEKK